MLEYYCRVIQVAPSHFSECKSKLGSLYVGMGCILGQLVGKPAVMLRGAQEGEVQSYFMS